jgi:hypothetical protein
MPTKLPPLLALLLIAVPGRIDSFTSRTVGVDDATSRMRTRGDGNIPSLTMRRGTGDDDDDHPASSSSSSFLAVPPPFSPRHRSMTTSSHDRGILIDDADRGWNANVNGSGGRRAFLLRPPLAAAAVASAAVAASASTMSRPANAMSTSSSSEEQTKQKPPPVLPLVTTAERLRVVPTFAIVDGNGVPFHTYDKDSAGGYGYFFTSYRSAEYVLDDARAAYAKAKDAEGGEGGEGGGNVDAVPDAWGQARITMVPLDAVMQLSIRKTSSLAQNGKGKRFDTYYQVIPSQEDQNAALKIEDGPRYRERGRVPLFYVDGLTLPPSSSSSSSTTMDIDPAAARMDPVYFRVQDLKDEWNAQYPELPLPNIRVRELNETFRAMIRPGGKETNLRNLVFVPSKESVKRAKDAYTGGYKLGEMILTK